MSLVENGMKKNYLTSEMKEKYVTYILNKDNLKFKVIYKYTILRSINMKLSELSPETILFFI